jgi:hypothetical protein
LDVEQQRTGRIFVALICIALLLFCCAISPSATHIDHVLPVLAFCFLLIFALAVLPVSTEGSAVHSAVSFAVIVPRAPPLG